MMDIVERLESINHRAFLGETIYRDAALEIEALRAENARLEQAVTELTEENRLVGLQTDRFADEIERLREALKPFAEVGECESASFSYHFIRAARAAMGESDE